MKYYACVAIRKGRYIGTHTSRVARLSRSPYPFYLCLSFRLIPAPSGCHLENTPVFANPLLAGGPTSPKQQRRQPHCNAEYGEYTEKSCSRRKVSVKRSVSRVLPYMWRCTCKLVRFSFCMCKHAIWSFHKLALAGFPCDVSSQYRATSFHCLGYVDCL